MTSLALIGASPTTALHALAAKALGWDIACIASRQTTVRDERAKQIGARACELDDLPDGIDVALVTTAAKDHVGDVMLCAQRASTVIVEPPVAISLDDSDALVAIASEHDVVVTYGDTLLYAPAVEAALAGIAEIGRLVNLEVSVTQPWPTEHDPTAESYAGAALMDLGVNAVSLAVKALAVRRIIAVSADLKRARTGPGDASADIDLHVEGGLTARIHAQYGASTNTWEFQAASDTGVVRLELTPMLYLERNGDPVALPAPRRSLTGIPQLDQYGYVGQLEAVQAGLDGDAGQTVDVSHGRTVTEVICAAYSSARDGGSVIALPFAGPTGRSAMALWYA